MIFSLLSVSRRLVLGGAFTRTSRVLPAAFNYVATRSLVTSTPRVLAEKSTKPKKEKSKEPKKSKAKKLKKKKEVAPPKIKRKDILAPPRPMASYIKFQTELRTRETFDTITAGSKRASELWKKMTEEEKEAYKASPAEVEEYKQKFQEWKTNLSPALRKARREYLKKRRTGNRRLTPYNMYIRERLSLHADQPAERAESFTVLFKRTSEAWLDLTESEKEVYVQQAQEYNEKVDSSPKV